MDNRINLEEAIDKNAVLELVSQSTQSGEGITMKDILGKLNIPIVNPPSSQQVGVFLALKKLLSNNIIVRDKVGKSFVYKTVESSNNNINTNTKDDSPADSNIDDSNDSSPAPTTPKLYNNTFANLSEKQFLKLIDKISAILIKRGYTLPGGKTYQDKIFKSGNNLIAPLPLRDSSGVLNMNDRITLIPNLDGKNELKTRGGVELKTKEDLQAVLPLKKTNKELKKDSFIALLPDILNNTWNHSGKWEKDEYYPSRFGLETGQRGPRTDHGGGEDGDGWMSNEQIRRVSKPYYDYWNPKLANFKKQLKEKGIVLNNIDMEYGEKGHIYLELSVNLDQSKLKNK